MQGGSADRKFQRIILAAPSGGDDAARSDTDAGDTEIGWFLSFRGRVAERVGVEVERAGILAIDGCNRLPFHGGGDVHLIREDRLASADIAGVDHDVSVHLPLLCVRLEVHKIHAEIDLPVVGSAIMEGKGHNIARTVVGIGAIDISGLASVFIIRIQSDQVVLRPVSESPDLDRPLPSTADISIVVLRICSGQIFLQVGLAVAVGVASGSVVWIAGFSCPPVPLPVIQGIKAMLNFPAVRQAVAIGVRVERIGFLPEQFGEAIGLSQACSIRLVSGEQGRVVDGSGADAAIAIGGVCRILDIEIRQRSIGGFELHVHSAVPVFVLTIAVEKSIAIRVGNVGIGLLPGFAGVNFVVRPFARQPRIPCRLNGLAIPVHPAIAVGVLDTVLDAVAVGVRVRGVGGGAGCLTRAVISRAERADTGDFPDVVGGGIERRVQIADEIRIAVAIRVGGGIGGRVRCGAPSDFERIRQAVAVGIRHGGGGFSEGIVCVNIPVGPGIGICGWKGFGRDFIRVQDSVVVTVSRRGADGNHLPQNHIRGP